MTQSAIIRAPNGSWFESLFEWFSKRPSRSDRQIADHEDARARRAFINEMIARNPDAFQSDLDVQNMGQMFPHAF